MRAQKRPRLIAVPRNQRPAEIPLAPLQRRLWIIDAIEGGSPEYHNVLAVRLTGALDEAALNSALTRLFMRHDVMRTRLPSRAGEPRQEIAEPGPIDLTRADLSGFAEGEREPGAKELLAAEQLRPYDLAAGPLARCLLVRLSDTDHVLAIAMHHVICDAGSFEVILSELDVGYRAALAGEQNSPEPLEVQVGSSRVDLQACKLEYSIVSPK